jgi:chromosome segregation ATPase
LPGVQAELDRNKSAMAAVREGLENQLAQERQHRQQLTEKHTAVVSKAKAIHADNLLLVKAVQEREQWMQRCGEQVQKLRQTNLEVLQRYRDKGFMQQLAELEPFTGIGQVNTESTVEDYVYKLKQLQVTPFEISDAEPAAVPADFPVDASESQP